MLKKSVAINLEMSHVPPVMRRGRHALIVLTDTRGHYYLGGKTIYPEGIYRLIGGGIDKDEDPFVGAVREIKEETGLAVKPKHLTHLTTINLTSTDEKHRLYHFQTTLFHYQFKKSAPVPSSDLDEIKAFSPQEFKQLINKFQSLPEELVYLSRIAGTEFRWSDYGKFYSQVHQLALDLTLVH
jgi:8-oxo-dGTP pyrophosphatase MutT (NUDIX family)